MVRLGAIPHGLQHLLLLQQQQLLLQHRRHLLLLLLLLEPILMLLHRELLQLHRLLHLRIASGSYCAQREEGMPMSGK